MPRFLKKGILWAALARATASVLLAQEVPADEPKAPPASPQTQHEDVRVVAATPVDGTPVDAMHYPGNIQHVSASAAHSAGTIEASEILGGSFGSVHLASPQGGDFEPDVFFRGFESSSLLRSRTRGRFSTPTTIASSAHPPRASSARECRFVSDMEWDGCGRKRHE